MKKKKSYIVKISIRKLEEIASYYQFPMVVFFGKIGTLKGRHRKIIMKKAIAFNRLFDGLKKILEEIENV